MTDTAPAGHLLPRGVLKYVLCAAGVASMVGLGYYYYYRHRTHKPGRQGPKATRPPKSVAGPGVSVSTEEERMGKAREFKTQGNAQYAQNAYKAAAELYTHSIDTYPPGCTEVALGYSNRAACWMNLKKYQECVDDCVEALKISPLMIKAIDRRSKALEALGMYREALTDGTACLFISNFDNEAYLTRTEALLYKLCEVEGKRIFEERRRESAGASPVLPASLNMREFFQSLAPLDLGGLSREKGSLSLANIEEALGESEGAGRAGLLLAKLYLHLSAQKYPEAFHDLEALTSLQAKEKTAALFDADVVRALSWYRAAFAYLVGWLDVAAEALGEHAPTDMAAERNVDINAQILSALVHYERASNDGRQGETAARQSMSILESALKTYPEDAYVLYHLTELRQLVSQGSTEDKGKIIEGYDRVIAQQPHFVSAYVHKARTLLQSAADEYNEKVFVLASKTLKAALAANPNSEEVLVALSEICMLWGKASESLEYLDRVPGADTHPNVLLNRAMLVLNGSGGAMSREKRDATAMAYLKRAVEIEPAFYVAHLQLANLYFATPAAHTDLGLAHFGLAIKHTRTLPELLHHLSVKEAALAQLAVTKEHPELAEKYKAMLEEAYRTGSP